MNRARTLTDAQTRDLLAKDNHVLLANMRHDAYYGMQYENISWRCAYVPASRDLDREALWEWHRRCDAAKYAEMGLGGV